MNACTKFVFVKKPRYVRSRDARGVSLRNFQCSRALRSRSEKHDRVIATCAFHQRSTYEEKIQRRSAFWCFAFDLRGRGRVTLVGSLLPRASEERHSNSREPRDRSHRQYIGSPR